MNSNKDEIFNSIKDKAASMVVLPSDNYIEGDKLFIDTLSQAVEIAERRRGLITIGVESRYSRHKIEM